MPGSFSFLAAKQFAPKAKIISMRSFSEVFASVTENKCTYAIVPIENSMTGSIYKNYDLLGKHRLHIVGELYLKIIHELLVVPGNTNVSEDRMGMIRTIYSHPKAIEQCAEFLRSHPNIRVFATGDTASAAKLVSDHNRLPEAAIASHKAGEYFNLKILKTDIQGKVKNLTRFMIVSRTEHKEKCDKATVYFTLAHRPGSLHSALGILAKRNINLTKIESRPIPDKPWEYAFYIDIEYIGSPTRLYNALKDLKQKTQHMEVLGIYKKGKTI